MSPNKITDNVFIHSVGEYNFYTVYVNERKYIVGGLPYDLCDTYIGEAKTADAVILLTAKPEFCGGMREVIKNNPHIEIYGTAAGLRNIKEIVNASVNEKLIKDFSDCDGIKFIITPNVHWADTVSALFSGVLFSGEMFSGGADFDEFYYERLDVNKDFVRSALNKLSGEHIDVICPSYGNVIDDVESAFDKYREFTAEKSDNDKRICIVYSSKSGYTKAMAECIKGVLVKEYSVTMLCADACDADFTAEEINRSSAFIIGTDTINRNAPQKIWDIITRLDLVNKRGTPYFVFGSYCWAGDGIKLVDKALSSMGFKSAIKPVEVLLNPSEDDFKDIEKGVEKFVRYKKS